MAQHPSIDEAISRLKAEIISQDWRLSEQRAAALAAAFACLQQRFRNRKAVHAILLMAGNVLTYIQRHGDRRVPETVDFIKEAMAHVVRCHESGSLDVEEDKRMLRAVYRRFTDLRRTVRQRHRAAAPAEAEPAPAALDPEAQAAPDAAPKDACTGEEKEEEEEKEIRALVQELKSSLRQAEETAARIRRMLVDLMAQDSQDMAAVQQLVEEVIGGQQQAAPAGPRPCPPTPVLTCVTQGVEMAVEHRHVCLVRRLPAKRYAQYRDAAHIPLADLAGLFRRLNRQFSGYLASLPERRLRRLRLPIMTVRAMQAEEEPPEEASHLVVLGHGQWHGILVCSEVADGPRTMIRWRRQPNGDALGTGYDETGAEFLLIDTKGLLEREGFLVQA